MASHHGHNNRTPHAGGGNTAVQHVSHESQTASHHSSSQAHGKESSGGNNKPTYKVYCRAETNHCLSIRNGEVILARANPSDQNQVRSCTALIWNNICV
nr:uncharacterized protein LOC109181915 [Ipomoea trifida]